MAVTYTSTELLQLFQNLLPEGPAWPRYRDSVQTALLTALADTEAVTAERIANLLIDAFPATSVELLPEWEASLSLPDPCWGPEPTIEQRQLSVVAKLTATGGQSIPYLKSICAAYGFFDPVFYEYTAYRCGMDFGLPMLGAQWNYALGIGGFGLVIHWFRCGTDTTGTPFATWDENAVWCELRRVAPGHIYLTFFFEEGGFTDTSIFETGNAQDTVSAADVTLDPPAGYTIADLIGSDDFTTPALDLAKWTPWQGWHDSTRIEGGALPSPYSGSHFFANSISAGFRMNLSNGSTTATLVWNSGIPNGLTHGDEYFVNDQNSLITPTSLFVYSGSTNSTTGSQSVFLSYPATGTATNRAVTVSHTDQIAASIIPTYRDPYPYAPSASPGGWPLETWTGLINTSPTDLAGGLHLESGTGVLQMNVCPTTSTLFEGLGWSTVGSSISSRTGGVLILPTTGGYVQVRAKMPDMSHGVWPEIWLMPDNGTFGSDDLFEIDLFEGGYLAVGTANSCVAQNFHNASGVTPSGNFTQINGMTQVFSDAGVDLSLDYHVYAAEIIPGVSIKTYFDNVLTATWTSGVPSATRYALILDVGFAAPTATGFRTIYDPAHPGPYGFLVNAVQFYGL